MYKQFYGLQEAPFSAIHPDRKFLFADEGRRQAYDQLLQGFAHGIGILLLTGEKGVGKTTLLQTLAERLQNHCKLAFIEKPEKNAEALVRQILEEYAAQEAEIQGSDDATMQLYQYLRSLQARGEHACVILDDAENTDSGVLRELILFTEFETKEKRLLQLCLSGGRELEALLEDGELNHFRAHVRRHSRLDAFSYEESLRYIEHRLQAAGLPANAALFERDALAKVYELSNGVPDAINDVCEKALKTGYTHGARYIDASIVEASFSGDTVIEKSASGAESHAPFSEQTDFQDSFQAREKPKAREEGAFYNPKFTRPGDAAPAGKSVFSDSPSTQTDFLREKKNAPAANDNGNSQTFPPNMKDESDGFMRPREPFREPDQSQAQISATQPASRKKTHRDEPGRSALQTSKTEKRERQKTNDQIARLVADEVHERIRFLFREYMLFKRPSSWVPIVMLISLGYLISILVAVLFLR